MLCECGYLTGPGWECCKGAITWHEHINCEKYAVVMFFHDKSVRSIFKKDEYYYVWNCEGQPIHQIERGSFLSQVHYCQNDHTCYMCKWSLVDYSRTITTAPDGFSYRYSGNIVCGAEAEEFDRAYDVLPLPIARAIKKQLPVLTLDSWRCEFNKKYPRAEIIERLFRE